MVRDLSVAGATPELFAEFRAKNSKAFRGFEAPEASIKCIEAAARLPFHRAKALPGQAPPAWIFLYGPLNFLSSTALRERMSAVRSRQG